MGSTNGNDLVTLLRNVYGITLGLDVGTDLSSLDGSFDGSNDVNLECLFLGESLGCNDGKVIGSYEGTKRRYTYGTAIIIILGNVDGITIGIYIGTYMGSLDRPIYCSNDGKIEGLLLGGSLRCSDGKVLGFDETIKLGLPVGKVLGTILGNVDEIKLGIDFETKRESLDSSFDGFNDSKSDDFLLEDFMGCTDGKVLGSDEGIKLGYNYGKFLGTIPVNVDGITLRIDIGTELGSLDGFFDGSNDDRLEGLLLEVSLGSTVGKHGS